MSFAAALPGRSFVHSGLAVAGRAHHRTESVPALVMGRGALLVLRVDLHQRRVNVEHQRTRAAALRPRLGACDRRGPPQRAQRRAVDAAQRPIQRRVRPHRPEQVPLRPQMLDICARLPAAGQHQQQMPPTTRPGHEPGPARRATPPPPTAPPVSPTRSAKPPKANSPAPHTTRSPPPARRAFATLLSFTSEMPP